MIFLSLKMKCKTCSQVFHNTNSFILHTTVSHRYLMEYICGYITCPKTFSNLSALKKHLTNFHTRPCFSKSNICPDLPATSTRHETENELSVNKTIEICTEDNTLQIIDNTSKTVEMQCLTFISKLYEKSTINRSVIQEVIDNVSELINTLFLCLSKAEGNELKNIVSSNPFDFLNSEHKRFKILEDLGYFIKSQSFLIGNRFDTSMNANGLAIIYKPCEGQIVPLRKVIQKFLEIPMCLEVMLNFIKNEESKNEISSIFNGQWWKKVKGYYKDKLVLPLFIYFDDFETGNPLGTQAGVHKLGGVYFSFPAIPPQYASRLENIFLWGLFYSSDRVTFSNSSTFQPFIEELKFLASEGLTVGNKRIFFLVPLLIGDNLGINAITGLTESFSSNYFCRACVMPKKLTQKASTEDKQTLRNKINYATHLKEISYGIKEECVFNQLAFYHNTENVSFDIMHDIYEGICRYDFGKILKHCIFEKKYFSLQKLNTRIKHFHHKEVDIGNKFPPIPLNQIEKEIIIMSSAEMHAFVTYFGILVYDLIDISDEVWKLYLLLFDIVHIVSKNSFSIDEIIYLNHLISEHHKLFIALFKTNLTPKYHFLTHYGTTIKEFGPLSKFSSIRYEAFHKISKSNAKVVSTRRNIPLTLAVKHQLRLSYRFILNKGLIDDISVGTSRVSIQEQFPSLLETQMDPAIIITWVKVNGVVFKPGLVIQLGKDEFTEPVFGKILKVVYISDENIKFVYKQLICYGFNKDLRAYEIAKCSEIVPDRIIDLKNIFHVPTAIHVAGDGCNYITCMNQD